MLHHFVLLLAHLGIPLAIVSWPYFFLVRIFRILGHAGMDFTQDTVELWYNTGDGVTGNILAILINTVFPFIIMGLLEGTGGGSSMIKRRAFSRWPQPRTGFVTLRDDFGISRILWHSVITIPMTGLPPCVRWRC